MKKVFSLILAFILALSMAACAGSGGVRPNETDATQAGGFMAGFGAVDITPEGSVPLSGFGNQESRFSTGLLSRLEARCLAVVDENGDKLLFFVADLGFADVAASKQILQKLETKYSIPADHVVISGTHTHSSVAMYMTGVPAVVEFNKKYVQGMLEAAEIALADCKPASVYVGSAMTEGMNFVRRYYMDTGALGGDGIYGAGTVYERHESEADGELQLMKLVREGGKDILVAQFQTHPHNLEGGGTDISSQVAGGFRNYVEKAMDVHCLFWNGAGGNLNNVSRIESENRTKDHNEYCRLLGQYAVDAYDSLTQVQTGPIKVKSVTFEGKVNHTEQSKLMDAQNVVAYFNECNDAAKTAYYGNQFGIHSLQHANRIIANARLGETAEIDLFAWSFGDVSGIVTEYEMFDTNGMEVKEGSPFAKTFIIGYSYPAQQGYIASALAYQNGGYEVDNGLYAPGTGEELVEEYLKMLKELKE